MPFQISLNTCHNSRPAVKCTQYTPPTEVSLKYFTCTEHLSSAVAPMSVTVSLLMNEMDGFLWPKAGNALRLEYKLMN